MPSVSWRRQTQAPVHEINSEPAQSGFDGRKVVAGEEPPGRSGAIVWRLLQLKLSLQGSSLRAIGARAPFAVRWGRLLRLLIEGRARQHARRPSTSSVRESWSEQ